MESKRIIFIFILLLLALPFSIKAKEFSVGIPAWSEQVAAAENSSEITKVRSVLILGVFGHETGSGFNLGASEAEWNEACNSDNCFENCIKELKRTQGRCKYLCGGCEKWKEKDCHWSSCGKWCVDKKNKNESEALEEILNNLRSKNVLDYLPKEVPTSSTCAVGFTQFQPTIWQGYQGKYGKDKLLNPWNINESFLTAGYYLADFGAASGNEKIALQKYYCGTGSYTNVKCINYANNVLSKAAGIEKKLKKDKVSEIANLSGRPVLTSPLKITPENGKYQVGEMLITKFTIANKGNASIVLDKLTVGGRLNGGCPTDKCADFNHLEKITLEPNQSYKYEASPVAMQAGNYHFFVAYYIQNPTLEEKKLLDQNNWNTSIELGEGLTDKDRVKDIVVVANIIEKPKDVSLAVLNEFKTPEKCFQPLIGMISCKGLTCTIGDGTVCSNAVKLEGFTNKRTDTFRLDNKEQISFYFYIWAKEFPKKNPAYKVSLYKVGEEKPIYIHSSITTLKRLEEVGWTHEQEFETEGGTLKGVVNGIIYSFPSDEQPPGPGEFYFEIEIENVDGWLLEVGKGLVWIG